MIARRGFTIIEVSLFIAVSAMLFVGIAAGTGINVARQRYSNSVQDYAEFLRRLYSQVENVENSRSSDAADRFAGSCTIASPLDLQNAASSDAYGRTNCAVYGKIAIFNEKQPNSDDNTDKIFVYDIIGRVVDKDHPMPTVDYSITNPTLAALAAVDAEYLAVAIDKSNNTCSVAAAGNADFYLPDWDSYIETTTKGQRFSGAVLIVRSPLDGVIHTFTLDLGVAGRITNLIGESVTCSSIGVDNIVTTAKTDNAYLNDFYTGADRKPQFSSSAALNFCVNSDDAFAYNGVRRNVRLNPNGSNASAVEIIEQDLPSTSGGNACL